MTVDAYLCAGFGEHIGPPTLQLISELGFKGVRLDVPFERESFLVSEFAYSPQLKPLFLIGGGYMDQPPNTPEGYAYRGARVARAMRRHQVHGAVEIGNEPDIAPDYHDQPERFAEVVRLARDAIRKTAPQVAIITGGIRSTDRRGLDYLEAVLDAGIPDDVDVGYHTYRPEGGGPLQPNPGFSSRAAEFHRLAAITLRHDGQKRRLWCTEAGFHTAPVRVPRRAPFCWLKRTTRFDDDDVARHLRGELQLNRAAGAVVACVYQLNDGPDPNNSGDRFGIRTRNADGTPGGLKPSAFAVEVLK